MAQSRVEEAQRTSAPDTAPPLVRWLIFLDSAGDQTPHSAILHRSTPKHAKHQCSNREVCCIRAGK